MRPLLLRVAGWVALSIIGSFAVLFVLTPPPEPPEPPVVAHLVGAGLGTLRDELAATAPRDRSAVLSRWQDRIAFPLTLAPNGEPPMVEGDLDLALGGPALRLPVDDEQLLVVGPLPFRAVRDGRLVIHAAAVAAISLSASLVVVWPLSRRLSALERASAALQAGALDARVPVDGTDLISRVGSAFNTMAEALARRMRDREELLEAVAHEVGTPLARIAFQLELLVQATEVPAVLARVAQVRVELAELDQLTSELTAWIRLDGQPVDRTPLDVCALAEQAIERSGAPDRVAVTLVLAAPSWCSGDGVWVRRAIENVVRNACHYAASAAVVTIRSDAGEVRVLVDDDGPGVPDGDRDRIFEPFTRLDHSRDRAAGGVGLGLAIVRRVMERHRGRVEVGRSPLGGARFVLVFPLATDAAT